MFFLWMETNEHEICILLVFECVLMIFVLSVMVFKCDMFVCFWWYLDFVCVWLETNEHYICILPPRPLNKRRKADAMLFQPFLDCCPKVCIQFMAWKQNKKQSQWAEDCISIFPDPFEKSRDSLRNWSPEWLKSLMLTSFLAIKLTICSHSNC